MFKLKAAIAAGIGIAALSAPATALAGTSGQFPHPLTNSDGSATFRGGDWRFNTGGYLGFVVTGNLDDTKADGDWVYLRGKVDGYGWGGGASLENHNGESGAKVPISVEFSDGDVTTAGKIQVCRHRGGVIPNICVESNWMYR